MHLILHSYADIALLPKGAKWLTSGWPVACETCYGKFEPSGKDLYQSDYFSWQSEFRNMNWNNSQTAAEAGGSV